MRKPVSSIVITEIKCFKCSEFKKYGKEVKGKFICNNCLSGKISSRYYRGRGGERSYLKTLIRMR